MVNTHSRRGRELYPGTRARLLAAGFDLLGEYPLDRPGRLEDTLAEALDLGPDLLITGGGDGTISTAARVLAHRDVAMGLLPLGTTNNFARTVGVPLGLDAAIATLTGGTVVDVDLGLAGDTPFTNHVGVGLSADLMLAVPRPLKRVIGRLAYPVTALALLARHRPLRVTITADGNRHEFRTHQLYVANGGFHAGRPITADSHADDRLLVAYPVGGPTRLAAGARDGPQRGDRASPDDRRGAVPRRGRAVAGDRPAGPGRGGRRTGRRDPDPDRTRRQRPAGDGPGRHPGPLRVRDRGGPGVRRTRSRSRPGRRRSPRARPDRT